MMFSIGNDSSSVSGICDNGSVDDSKPNSIYGGSVRQAAHMGVFQLQDLSPRSTGVYFNNTASDFDDCYIDSTTATTAAASAVFNGEPGDIPALIPEPMEYEEQPQYMLDSASIACNQFPAECCVERASASRRERYYFTMGKKNTVEPGGGGSAAGYRVAAGDSRMAAGEEVDDGFDEDDAGLIMASGGGLGVRVARHCTQSSSSTLSSGAGDNTNAVPQISMQDAPRRGRTRTHGVGSNDSRINARSTGADAAVAHASASFYASAEQRKRSHDLALNSASDLQREIFPLGVPSQGILKSGSQHISANVWFRAVGCEQRPWHGFIIDDVLFVYVSEFAGCENSFRVAVMALMELAEDVLLCSEVIIALPRALSSAGHAGAASLVRAFMYSGFELVSPMLYQPSPAYVLLGYDAM
ncbi:hypothetical protein LPJ57_002120 [Coemansia sp. RSA 486]|nr:hypothetical protein LPJ57_002120 [Coemansia sp. RSA 486]KAJ2600330.1 hypothetical protein GGF39_001828 [Coemansia sp. RSA 1721]